PPPSSSYYLALTDGLTQAGEPAVYPLDIQKDPLLLVTGADDLGHAPVFHHNPAGGHQGQHRIVSYHHHYLSLAGKEAQCLLLFYSRVLDLVYQYYWRVADNSNV